MTSPRSPGRRTRGGRGGGGGGSSCADLIHGVVVLAPLMCLSLSVLLFRDYLWTSEASSGLTVSSGPGFEAFIATLLAANEREGSGGYDEGENMPETAIVFMTQAPVDPALLEGLYNYSRDLTMILAMKGYGPVPEYKIVLIVYDVTEKEGVDDGRRLGLGGSKGKRREQEEGENRRKTKDTATSIREYYNWRENATTDLRLGSEWSLIPVPPPIVFEVSHVDLLKEFPRLGDNNGSKDKTFPLRVQMPPIPLLVMFLRHNPQFEYAWHIDEDLQVEGKPLMSLIATWDSMLVEGEKMKTIVDLTGEKVASSTYSDDWYGVRLRQRSAQSWSFCRALALFRWGQANYENDKREVAGSEWRSCYSDTVLRFSRRFAEELHREISSNNNVYRFGEDECFVSAMARHGKFEVRALSALSSEDYGFSTSAKLGGLEYFSRGSEGRTMTREDAVRELKENSTEYVAFAYKRWSRQKEQMARAYSQQRPRYVRDHGPDEQSGVTQ